MDVKELGFTILHSTNDPQFDVVFIHGLQGNPATTWTLKDPSPKPWEEPLEPSDGPKSKAAKSKYRVLLGGQSKSSRSKASPVFWPQDILPIDFPNSRIATYGYDSKVSNFFGRSANQNDITKHGNDFLEDLAAFRSGAPRRPLMIISHSLGGLITKDALRRSSRAAQNDASDRRAEVLRSAFALIFFGTPHRGGTYANLGLDLAHFAAAAGFSVNSTNIRELDGASGLLSILREEFVQLLDRNTFQVTTFQESLGITRLGWLNKKIVPDVSSAIDHRNERKHSINANHMDMCRFASNMDPAYQKVKSEIQRHVTRITLQTHLGVVQDAIERGKQRCLDSLEIPEVSLRVAQTDAAHTQTLNWLYENPRPGLGDWLENGHGEYWIQGKPGSGKSTVIKYLFQNPQTAYLLGQQQGQENWKVFGCFFTYRGGEAQRSWSGILSSMLHQLLSTFPSLITEVITFGVGNVPEGETGATALIKAGKTSNFTFSWSEDALKNALLACKEQTELPIPIFILIDALDEHEGDHQKMGEFLHKLTDTSVPDSGNEIKVCVASRPLNQLKDLFGGCAGFTLQDWTGNDIEKYVQNRLSGSLRIKEICQQQESAKRVRNLLSDIIGRAEGVFLWVRLVIDELCTGLTDGLDLDELEEIISEIPVDLQSFFQRMLTKIDPRYRRDCYIILEAILRSRIPLTARQLQLTLRANSSRLSDDELITSERTSRAMEAMVDNSGMARRVQSCCGGLVELKFNPRRPQDSTVQFLHQTVKEFIADSANLDFLFRATHKVPASSRPREQGHDFMLRAYWYWLNTPRESRKHFEVFDANTIRKELLYHLPHADQTIKVYSTRIIDQTVHMLASEDEWGRYWSPKLLAGAIQPRPSRFGSQWLLNVKPSPWTIVSLGITLNFYPYLSEKLQRDPGILKSGLRSGLSCFAFLLCDQDQKSIRASATVAELLIRNGADVKTLMDYTVDGETRSMDAMGLFMCNRLHCDWNIDNGSHTQIFRCILEAGANPNGTYPYGFFNSTEHIAYAIARLKVEPHHRLELFKALADHGGSAKLLDPLGEVTIQSFLIENIDLELDAWLWLLEHGARITRRMVEELGLFTDSSLSSHPLREHVCRCAQYYELSARQAARNYNRHWTREDVYGILGNQNWFGSWQPSALTSLLQGGPRKQPL